MGRHDQKKNKNKNKNKNMYCPYYKVIMSCGVHIPNKGLVASRSYWGKSVRPRESDPND